MKATSVLPAIPQIFGNVLLLLKLLLRMIRADQNGYCLILFNPPCNILLENLTEQNLSTKILRKKYIGRIMVRTIMQELCTRICPQIKSLFYWAGQITGVMQTAFLFLHGKAQWLCHEHYHFLKMTMNGS